MNKKYEAVLFDLDGTLLPMDLEIFTNSYFKLLSKAMVKNGYEPQLFSKALYKGIEAMLKNDGTATNEEKFWQALNGFYGEEKLIGKRVVDEFYKNDFNNLKLVCGYNARACECIEKLKKSGYRLILATNPIFPEIATLSRVEWTGVNSKDFEYISTYENSCFCKPNGEYYNEILKKCGLSASKCLMVGNDVIDDMSAKQVGIDVFLLTDNLINVKNEDISAYPQGDFDDLIDYLN
ncbi:MAG: HAD family hydrolase [Christensenellaceae bacterium]